MTDAMKKRLARRSVAAEAQAGIRLSDAIADLAEPGFEETGSVQLMCDYLRDRGFEVEFPWRSMPTAFRAVRGTGGPSIGVLAEYDALPDCGAEPGTWGHGCGHNLLGAGSAVGAVAAAEALGKQGLGGTIVLWGCPAEEILAGKVYMARDGAFCENDAIVGWHPGSATSVSRFGGASMDSIMFEFFGKTAHGTSAHLGRSALDGVMLLDVAANYLREHVPENVRIHMSIRDGGDAPNVVPAYAKSWYYVRGKDRAQVDEVRRRLEACARGAAMATETKVRIKRLAGVYSRLGNDAMGDAVLHNLKLLGAPRVTPADQEAVRELGKKADFSAGVAKGSGGQGRGSSDEDNVSWLSPLGRFCMACVCKGTTGHHRDFTLQTKLPFAHKGMLRAAEVIAATALDLYAHPELLDKARQEFRRRTKGFTYDPLVPKRQKPPSVNP